MELAIACPYCNVRPVQTARKIWFLQGLLLVARYGSQIAVGCEPCVQREVRNSLARSSLLGWWSFPWGLATPFVILQNLACLLTPSAAVVGTLDAALGQVGLDRSDLERDDDGLSREQSRMVSAAVLVMRGAMAVDGDISTREVERAVAILTQFTAHTRHPLSSPGCSRPPKM